MSAESPTSPGEAIEALQLERTALLVVEIVCVPIAAWKVASFLFLKCQYQWKVVNNKVNIDILVFVVIISNIFSYFELNLCLIFKVCANDEWNATN